MEHKADVTAISSLGVWIAANIAQINQYLQAISFTVAIVTGAFAITAYLVKFWRWLISE